MLVVPFLFSNGGGECVAVNKVVMNTKNGTDVLLDLTQDTVTPETLLKGITAHSADGTPITGTMSGTEGVNAQSKRVVPTTEEQVVTPDSGYNYLSQVTVAAIPYYESGNSAGGTTVTIG